MQPLDFILKLFNISFQLCLLLLSVRASLLQLLLKFSYLLLKWIIFSLGLVQLFLKLTWCRLQLRFQFLKVVLKFCTLLVASLQLGCDLSHFVFELGDSLLALCQSISQFRRLQSVLANQVLQTFYFSFKACNFHFTVTDHWIFNFKGRVLFS